MKSNDELHFDEIATLKARLVKLEETEAKMRLAVENLLKSEAKFRMIADYTFDCEEWRSPDGKYIYVSPACERISGYTSDEFMDDPWLITKIVHPEDQEVLSEHLGKDFAQPNVLHVDFRIVSRSGEERWISHYCQPVYGPDGTWIGRRASNRDITERKRTEALLRESESRYKAIVEDQTELICRFLPDGKVTYVNQAYCDYFEKQYDEIIGCTFMPLIPDEDRQRVKDHLASLSPESPMGTCEHRVIAPHGEIRWQQWTNRMILDEGLGNIEFQSVGRDITERVRAEEALKRSLEKIKMFAYSVSHDLKSPAIATYGLAKLLHKNYRDVLQEKGRNYCDQILKACEHMASLVEQINAYIRTTEVVLHIETVSLNQIIEIVRAEFSSQLSLRQVKWNVMENPPDVKGDRLSLLRVVRNLVDNALKYGGDKLGEIKVGFKEKGEFNVLFVEDDGVGIRERDTQRLFGTFRREKTSVGIEGVGLGLAIVKQIAEQHGGEAWIETSRKGGTRILVSLSKHPQN